MNVLDHIRNFFLPPEGPCPAIHEAPGRSGLLLRDLQSVIDPEVGLDIVNLGLIRSVSLEGRRAVVSMTLTTQGCPMAAQILAEVEEVMVCQGLDPHVHWTFDPPWEPAHISDAGRAALDE